MRFSRVAGLMAVAVFGVVLSAVFNHALDRRLDGLRMAPPVRKALDDQRPRLAAMETKDPSARKAIAASFVDGYRVVLWSAVALAVASSISAGILIGNNKVGKDRT